MQKFLSLLFSRRALAIVGVIVLALLVWFVGPLVSFDTLRPLASVGSRVVTIALLLMLLVLWLVNWSMSIIGISILCLVIGFVTPLLALGDVHPFAPLWVRLTLIGFILLVYALYGLYRLWRALRMDEQLLRRFLHPRGEEVPVAGEIKADLRTVSHIVTQAVRQLKQLRVDMPGWRKIFEGKRFLYELPWFMVVGSPGDGKTTALLNTGLQFPLAEQMEQTSRILTVPGGGTLHCDWWFTNEAVLIDTAGRYARHDDGGEASATQRNAGEWQGFLGLLRKHRPGAPLNGVILTLNVADLTAQSPAERLAACAALRARLAELRETLGIRFPVYLVVTKMDLLPGFSEYFRTLTSHLRAQIWGFTLPYSRKRKVDDPQALHVACERELTRLTLRLDQGLDTRLQEEYDLKSRQRLYTFPREFSALGAPLLEAIEQIFLDSKFDATQLNNTLRGVFFTSAAQAQADAVADQLSIWQRFVRAIKTARGEPAASRPRTPPAAAHPHTALHCSAARTIPVPVLPVPAFSPASPATAGNARPAVPLPALLPVSRSVPGCAAMYAVIHETTVPTTAPAATLTTTGPPALSVSRAALCPAKCAARPAAPASKASPESPADFLPATPARSAGKSPVATDARRCRVTPSAPRSASHSFRPRVKTPATSQSSTAADGALAQAYRVRRVVTGASSRRVRRLPSDLPAARYADRDPPTSAGSASPAISVPLRRLPASARSHAGPAACRTSPELIPPLTGASQRPRRATEVLQQIPADRVKIPSGRNFKHHPATVKIIFYQLLPPYRRFLYLSGIQQPE